VIVHGRQVELGLTGDAKRLAARRHDPKGRGGSKQLGERPGGVGQELLQVVEEDMGSLLADARRDRGGIVGGSAQARGDQGQHQRCVADGGERYEHRGAVRLFGQEPGELDRESRLAGATGTDDREHPRLTVEPLRGGLEQLALAAEEPRGRSGKVDGPRRSQRRERRCAELKQLDGRVEVLEPMPSEIPQRLVSDERRRHGGDEHLAAVCERGHSRAAMDVDPDVALRSHVGGARVQAHPHGERPRRERPLPGCRGADGSGGGREGDEERVPLGVDLHTALGGERSSEDAAVLGERLGVGVGPELAQEAGGPLDIGEQERHRPGGQVPRHASSIADDLLARRAADERQVRAFPPALPVDLDQRQAKVV
jgi:hypothetical protein